jgi:hypothetical protein
MKNRRWIGLVLALACCGYDDDYNSASFAQQQTPPPASPGQDRCCDYLDGGQTGVHSYTCCQPQFGACSSITFHGGPSWNSYCDADGNPTGGGTVGQCYQMSSQCPESACNAALACQTYCNGFVASRMICWNWTRCFRVCMGNQVSNGTCRPSPVGTGGGGGGGGTCSADGGCCCASGACGSATCVDGDCTDPVACDASSASCPDGYELLTPGG